MSGLFSLLNSTAAALNAQTQAITVTGNNIANVNSPNYSRETVQVADLGEVQTADGVESTGMTVSVTQQRSAILDQMVRQEASLSSGYSAQQGVLQQAQASLGESVSASSTSASGTASVGGLSAAINAFFNAVESYAASPGDQTQSQAVVQQASVLTDRFQQVDGNLSQVQANATAQVSQDVGTVNGLLQQVAQLNGQIHSVEVNAPGSAVALRDQREGVLEQLAAYLPVSVTEGASGEDQVTTADSQGQPVTLVSDATVPATLSVSGGSLFAGPQSVALSPSSGSLQGNLTAGSGAVQSLRAGLDSLAGQIVAAVNAAYNPGGAAGGNFFDSSGTTAGTISLDPALTAATLQAGPAGGGDNSSALAMGAVANQTFSTASGDSINGTITQTYAALSAGIGQALSTATTQLTDQTNVQTIVGNERTSLSGVSLDQEMSNLVMYQRAYQASSEVFSVIDQLLSNLATSLGSVTG